MMAAEVREGQEVRVYDINGRRVGQPTGGWQGTITKVGRVLVTIKHDGSHEEQTFRLDTQQWNNPAYGFHRWYLTLGQVEQRQRRVAARQVLRQAGLELLRQASPTLEQLEAVAEAVKDWPAVRPWEVVSPAMSGGE